ncbi:MAG: metal ABC transporter substrate-binding protein [Desulfovibrio sp.]|jgi:ABC-type Zn uptake system ZnuABC Zn-binding protein ZnuA|nr:metal ABC transporter substrate-binding protein [Desulfovibrio sp.]
MTGKYATRCAFLLCVFFFCTAPAVVAEELRVLATTFPVYLFTRNVARDCPNVRVDLLIPAQTGCPHEYTLTPQDLQKLAKARIIVRNGLGIDAFLHEHFARAAGNARVIDCSAGVKPLRANPHLFAGPKEAAMMVRNIAAGLSAQDADNANAYNAAARAYADRLLELDRRLAALGGLTRRKGVVLQHDALAYIADSAGLSVVAVIQEDEDTPPSAGRLVALTRRMQSEKPVLIISDLQYPDKPVRTLSRETGVPAVGLDTVAAGPADAPLDYYEAVMTVNCQTLETYFGQQ